MKVIFGNILIYPANFIIHQCNCVITNGMAGGLAKTIFEKWPQCNTYYSNIKRIPGTFDIFKVEKSKYIVNLYSQYNVGKYNQYETEMQRLNWYEHALTKLSEYIPPNSIISFPYFIGCGLAGGDWSKYLVEIQKFEEKVKTKNSEIVIIRLV